MRIIAGEWGGRHLQAPAGNGTRPMLDRVRESLFGVLGDLVEDARVLDLYAGSGSLGLEALSRGARHARFVERGAAALDALKANANALGANERARIVRGNALSRESWSDAPKAAFAARKRAGKSRSEEAAVLEPSNAAEAPPPEVTFDLVFFDPPYALLDAPAERARLFATVDELADRHLTAQGVVVFHLPEKSIGTLRFASGRRGELRTYGTSTLCLIWKRDETHLAAGRR